MFLAIDIGNTRTTFGLFQKSKLVDVFFANTAALEQEQEKVGRWLEAHTNAITLQAAVASVVPSATAIIEARIGTYASLRTITTSNIPIQNDYATPLTVGIDRLLSSLAAHELWGAQEHKPCVVVDLGTATTYNCITKEGAFLGGAIALGIASSAEYLATRTAQLPKIPLAFPPQVLGRSTVEAIQSGILYGGVASVEGMIARLSKEVFPEERPVIVATGGLSTLIAAHTEVFDQVEPNLVLYGIRVAAKKLEIL